MKQLLSGLALSLLITLSFCKTRDCDPPSNDQVINVTLKANETYSYELGSFGDEEGVLITRQAMHYQISRVYRKPDFSNVTYEYKPALDYTGTDEVELRSDRGWNEGASYDKTTRTTIKFTIIH